jgi:hypothetical protein
MNQLGFNLPSKKASYKRWTIQEWKEKGGAVQVRGALCGPSSYNGGGMSVGKESAEGAESRFQRRSTTKASDEQNPVLDKGSCHSRR